MVSVNTNYGALVALQNLNSTNRQLDEVQSRINPGLKVSSAKDNGAVFAVAQSLRSRVGALSAVNEGLDRTVTNLDTAQSAGSQVSDILKTLQQTGERGTVQYIKGEIAAADVFLLQDAKRRLDASLADVLRLRAAGGEHGRGEGQKDGESSHASVCWR
jgi:hypothetical protein